MKTLADIRVANIMTADVLEAQSTATLLHAAKTMRKHGVHSLIVPPDHPSRLPGIITIKDIVEVLAHQPMSSLSELLVADAMTQPAITIQHTLCVADCINLMRTCGVRSAPVMDQNKVVGILSFSDVVRYTVQ